MGKNTRDMTVGSPLRHIIAFTIPVLGGIIFQQFYNMADSMIVGKLLGADALAAVGCTGNVCFLIVGLCMGTCTGFAVPVSQFFGAKDIKNLKKCVGNSIWITAILTLIFTLFTTIMCRQILTWMRTPGEILDMASEYLFIIFLGIPASILYNLLSAYLRALGNSKIPLVFIIVSSVLNIILDIIFILTFKMGVSGAAWATILSQAISGIACLVYIIFKFELLHVKKEDLVPDGRVVKLLFSAGLPMGLQFSITAIGGSILQYFINGLGTEVIAAFSAGFRMEAVLGCVTNALGSTMATYVGQNTGARKYDRLKKGLITAVLISWAYCLTIFVLMIFFSKYAALLFINKEETQIINYLSTYLIILTGCFVLLTIVNIIRPAIQGMGYAAVAMFAGLFELLGRGLAGLILVPKFGFMGACFGAPLAWFLADIFLVITAVTLIRKLEKKANTPTAL